MIYKRIKYLFGLLSFFIFYQSKAQVIFKDDFGNHLTRVSTPYVPQSGSDANHYIFADLNLGGGTTPDWNNVNNYADWTNLSNINDGYYSIANPGVFSEGASWKSETWWPWYAPNLTIDHTGNGGGVMALNAGVVLNQIYRRAQTLERGSTYEFKAYIKVLNQDVKVALEAQDILDDTNVLGAKVFPQDVNSWENNTYTLADNGTDGWIELKWTFTVPTSTTICGDIAVAIRNKQAATNNNDFYIDDISLTKVDASLSEGIINCAVSSFSNVLKTNDNQFTLDGQAKVFDITSDDKINGTNNFIFSGTSKNASIYQVGLWPTGFSIDSNGGCVVASGIHTPVGGLEYQICNLSGTCSTAMISFDSPASNIIETGTDLFKMGLTTSLNILSNDKIKTSTGTNVPIVINDNVSVKKVGTWPNGVSLDENTSVVTVDYSILTAIPSNPVKYMLCEGSSNCKEEVLIFQKTDDGLKLEKSTVSTQIKNGESITYTINIINSTASIAKVDFLDYFLKNDLSAIYGKDNIEFTNWTLSNFQTNLSTQLTTSTENKLGGILMLEGNKTGSITITAKILNINEVNLNSKASAFANNINDEILTNNTKIITTPVILLNPDLAISSMVANSNTFVEDNIITVRLTNTGTSSITSTVNQIKVKFNIPLTSLIGLSSNQITGVNPGSFTPTDNYKADTSRDYTFTLNSGVTIPVGGYVEFSFKKERGYSGAIEQLRTTNFSLDFVSDTNAINNASSITLMNSPEPGKISFSSSSLLETINVCYGNSTKIYNNISATSNVTAANINYKFQISINNGLSWEFLKDSSGNDINLNNFTFDASGYTGLSIPSVTSKTLIRRYAFNVGNPQLNSVTEPIVAETTQNEIKFDKGINSFAIQEYLPTLAGSGKFIIPAGITTTEPSDVVITKSDGSVVTPGQELTGLTAGEYEFTVTATTKTGAAVVGCITSTKFKLIVYSLANCNVATKKIFATHQQMWTSGLSGVADPERAVNGDRSQYATLTGGVVLLGIGTVGIDLYFTKPNGTLYTAAELKGKKVTIKLGEQYSGLKIAGGVTVVGRNINSLSDISGVAPPAANTGFTYGVKGGLLDALKGDNVFEFSFVPSQSNGTPVDFNGIRIQLGSLLGVADLATVFHAYIEEDYTVNPATPETPSTIQVTPPASLIYPTEQRDIDGTMITGINNIGITLNNFTDDVTWGNRSEVLNVASGLSSVVHPYYAVDNNYDSYTLFNSTAGVLNQQFLRTHLRQVARPGDQIQITLAYPNLNVLNLSLLQLGNFKIVYYLGDVEVGSELMEEFRVLDIGLFNFKNKRRAVISKPIKIPFDSFEIQQFNTVSVNLGDGLHIHDIRVAPMMLFNGQLDPKEVTPICAADFLGIQSPDFCTDYAISFAKIISFGDAYTNTDGSPLLDKEGNPIKMITAVEDIPNSELTYSHIDGSIKYYTINQLYTEHEIEGIILVKVQTMRQGANYGDPQYLRVKLSNCNEAIVNPVIKLNTNK